MIVERLGHRIDTIDREAQGFAYVLTAERLRVWLDQINADPDKLKYLFEPPPDSELIAYKVNPVVNNARHDAADCIEAALAD